MQRTLELPSRPEAVASALDTIEASLVEARASHELALEFRLLGEEAITNVVKYADAESMVVLLDISDDTVVLELRDDGKPFDPLGAAAPDLEAGVEERSLGGLGIHLIQTLADDVSYERDGEWNVLRLTKSR